MKMLEDSHGISVVVTPALNNELKRLQTAAEGLALALRYRGIRTRDEQQLDSLLKLVSFVDEVKEEVKTIRTMSPPKAIATLIEYAPNWTFELSFVREERNLARIDDTLDTLFQCFAESCLWLPEILKPELPENVRTELTRTYFELLDFVACGALSIITGSAVEKRAAA